MTAAASRAVVAAPVYVCAASPETIKIATEGAVGGGKSASALEAQVCQVPAPPDTLKRIKLLRILSPIDPDAPSSLSPSLRCSLEIFDWQQCPAYIALSYVWGTAKPQHSILVNDTLLPVLPNLHSADAICINQADEEEKSNQVQHMGDIFKRAAQVIAWLGGPLDPTSRGDDPSKSHLLEHLADLGDYFWAYAGRGGKLSDVSTDLTLVFRQCLPVLYERFQQPNGGFPVAAYTSFSNLPYWKRVWVLQEVLLAQDLWFYYDRKRISLRSLSGALVLLEQFQKHIATIASSSSSMAPRMINQSMRQFAFANPSFPEMYRLIIYTSVYPASLVSLRVAMANFCIKERPRGAQATDPRDMVFGLLGFATVEERRYIQADYGKSVRDSYRDVAHAMVANGFADIVSWAQRGEKRLAGLPSWVPDFAATVYEPLCSQGQAKPWLPRFRACGGRAVEMVDWALVELDAVGVRGVLLDTVVATGLLLWEPREVRAGTAVDGAVMPSRSASYEAILRFLDDVERLVRRSRAALAPQTDEVMKAVARVACADQLVLGSRLCRAPPADLMRYFNQTREAVRKCVGEGQGQGAGGVPLDAYPYIECMLRWVKKRPFLTANGYVGLGPGDAREGDVVAVLYGFSAPYVLRRVRGRDAQRYEVVGEAYVDGVMDGQAVSGAGEASVPFFLV
ncbi:heterokaryon incompatibility protein-domain-containing protein [Podospora appendiculata]|uniref:Heterokaryon incompatibility protein-domain-containing protein n=1 Tax=Podospora appendiculata TaxID=314037 RepID=A0AAE1C8K3_9PEZI|nr:heterokaryon incompatibility protein-domain-containing protein [Podospora appendiculata]